ncbi:hypothetical protein [Pseudomonas helleri]|nr:hypothetical protein [Pseudomonas helleri]
MTLRWMLLSLVVLCAGCQYLSYEQGCTDNPNQRGCQGGTVESP